MIFKKAKIYQGGFTPMSVAVGAALLAGVAFPSMAQNTPSRTQSILLEEVVVTARKRDESMQDVPIAVAAFNSDQIDALKVRTITDLTVGIPNVSLDDVATTKGTANFMIRGLGINSSIPSIDPTVGIFIDGVYLGNTNGVMMDVFDLERIEVLRGPQGTLFGRNVTGGAVLINHKKAPEEFEFTARAGVDGNPNGDGGLNYIAMASVGGPISETLRVKLTGYYNHDEGWLVNEFDGENAWGNRQKTIRPALVWTPTDTLEVVVAYEYSDTNGDGAASQSHTSGLGLPGTPTNFSRNGFKFSNDEPGFQYADTKFLTSEINWNVDFGEGVVTNIFGWRDYQNQARIDIDSQPVFLLHADGWLNAEQYSNEVRYTGRFNNKYNVTTGLYYFNNDVTATENRDVLGALTPDNTPLTTQTGGGIQETESFVWFGSIDYDLTESWVLNVGMNYTYEEKEVEIASLPLNVDNVCSMSKGTCPIDFRDDQSWSNWSPKLGATYTLSDDEIIYGSASIGYRSGGYNFRNTAIDTVNFGPGPTDEEKVTSYEIGYKGTLMDGRAILNAAAFFTTVDDMQREINLSDPSIGIVQVVRNTADAELWGVEIDGRVSLVGNLVAIAAIGYTHSEYTEVRFDLNGDGVIDGKDKDLDLPRAAEWTYSLGLNLDTELGDHGYMTSRISYAYRDDSPFTDNNLGTLNAMNIVEAGIDYHTANDKWTFSVYGRNLLNEAGQGSDTQLPALLGPVPLGGTLSPRMSGRKVGIEVTYRM